MNIGGDWYHFNNLGYASSGWDEIGGNWYYFDSGLRAEQPQQFQA